MLLKCKPYLLEFKHPFGVSSNTRKETPTVFVCLEAENQKGYGEACLPVYLGETVESTLNFFDKAAAFFLQYDATLPLHFFLDEIQQMGNENYAAKAALDIALHDLYG